MYPVVFMFAASFAMAFTQWLAALIPDAPVHSTLILRAPFDVLPVQEFLARSHYPSRENYAFTRPTWLTSLSMLWSTV
ncbi:protein of unknown function [Kyrpidia spormannii]|uniref:Uncharacterized protein n=1 Tax=Kyrpidia spormannii TaxID=2055160 RepID=A0ACA8ZE34_9BACL|nr:protein of unknown function [Kyrpidia spormannii]